MTRIEKAIRKWAKVTEHPVTEWAVLQWVKELTEHEADEERIVQSIAYLVQQGEKPHLGKLRRTLEEGFPRPPQPTVTEHTEPLITDQPPWSDENLSFLRMMFKALSTREPLQDLLICIAYHKEKYPHLDWSDPERVITERINHNTTDFTSKTNADTNEL